MHRNRINFLCDMLWDRTITVSISLHSLEHNPFFAIKKKNLKGQTLISITVFQSHFRTKNYVNRSQMARILNTLRRIIYRNIVEVNSCIQGTDMFGLFRNQMTRFGSY